MPEYGAPFVWLALLPSASPCAHTKVFCGCSRCSSLAFQPPEELAKTLDLARQAGITVVSLPLVNQWTQASQSAPFHSSGQLAGRPVLYAALPACLPACLLLPVVVAWQARLGSRSCEGGFAGAWGAAVWPRCFLPLNCRYAAGHGPSGPPSCCLAIASYSSAAATPHGLACLTKTCSA